VTSDERRGSTTRGYAKATLLGLLLALHFFTRLHGQQVTALHERHFYSLSYLVSLSVLEGRGFGYLLPPSVSPEDAYLRPIPPLTDPAFPVLAFLKLAGTESVSPEQLADYSRRARVVAADPFESTRVLDIHLAAWLWRAFGVGWLAYFCFYALLSTASCLAVFLIVLRATGSYWAGFAAAAGFLASPLEHYAGVWSTRDSVPLWFTSIAFAALSLFPRSPSAAGARLVAAFGAGIASLIGLGWRPDFQVVPPLVLTGLVATLLQQRRNWREIGGAIAAFGAGCAAVLLLLRTLGPGAYSQGGTVFHTAWYGETPRSNLLQLEDAVQVARDDRLTLYQANYFALARGEHGAAGPLLDPKDPRHHQRCRAMYLELARYQASSWWTSFPAFLGRSARLDRPTPLASEDELTSFRSRRARWLRPLYENGFDRYGAILPGLALIGLAGGLLASRTRITAAIMAVYYVAYCAILLLVLPEAKHSIPLLLPIHVLAGIGWWSMARGLGSWREFARLPRVWPRLVATAIGCLAVLLAWGALGLVAHVISRAQRARIVDAVRRASEAGARPTNGVGAAKLLSVSADLSPEAPRVGYLLRVRAQRPSDLLLVHVRGTGPADGFLAYFTRHPIEPGADRLFFFNVVAGEQIGDPRPYTAHVRLVGTARVVSWRKVDLTEWPLGLPLSLVFDENDRRPGATRVGGGGPAIGALPTPSDVRYLLYAPRIFLVPYRAED
jgi:hypothetical protein